MGKGTDQKPVEELKWNNSFFYHPKENMNGRKEEHTPDGKIENK